MTEKKEIIEKVPKKKEKKDKETKNNKKESKDSKDTKMEIEDDFEIKKKTKSIITPIKSIQKY